MKKLLTLVFILVLFSGAANAQYGGYDAGTLNRQYVQDMRMHEATTRARQNSAIVKPKTATQVTPEVKNADIKSVVFVNNNSISSTVLNNLVKDKINQPMTAENIADIRKNVMRFYQDQGYFSAVVMVVSQDSQTGELTLEVKEGGKNSIQIQE